MKHLPVIALLLLVSCAPRKKVIVENNYDDSEVKTRLSDLEQRVASLGVSRLLMISSMNFQQSQLNALFEADGELSESIANLQSSLSSAQTMINALSSQIVTLQNNVNISQVIDPCNDAPNKYDEVIFKMSNGTYVASFSDNASGLNTRFSVLPVGNYQSTDGTNCRFSVNANGTLTW